MSQSTPIPSCRALRPFLGAAILTALSTALSGALGAAAAQGLTTSLDAGVATVRYSDSLDITAATLSPYVGYRSDRLAASAAATYSHSGPGVWTTQGSLSGSFLGPELGPLRPELSAVAGGSAHEDGARTGELLAELRAHLVRGAWGLWAGGGAGRTWDGATWRGVAIGSAGAWARIGPTTVTTTVTPAAVDDSIRYTDAELTLRWDGGRFELRGTLGARAGEGLPVRGGSRKAWGGISALVWVHEHLAVVGGAGSYPVDFTQGFPGGRYATIGLRLTSRTPRSRPRLALGAPPGMVTEFAVRDAGSGNRTFRVHAADAARVEIAGDFTDWQPIPLIPSGDGWWSVTLPVASGTYQVNIRLDGDRWIVPPGLLAVADEFAGSVGLLTIP